MLSKSISRSISAALLALALVFGGPAAADPEGAAAFVQRIADDVIALVSDPSVPAARRERMLADEFRATFDLATISRYTLGRYWDTATAAERAEYRAVFVDFLVHKYVGLTRFAYGGERLMVTGSQAADVGKLGQQTVSGFSKGSTFCSHKEIKLTRRVLADYHQQLDRRNLLFLGCPHPSDIIQAAQHLSRLAGFIRNLHTTLEVLFCFLIFIEQKCYIPKIIVTLLNRAPIINDFGCCQALQVEALGFFISPLRQYDVAQDQCCPAKSHMIADFLHKNL